jgi:TonB family protein
MNRDRFEINPRCLRRAGMRLFQAAALALLVALAMPIRAADDRPIKMRVAPVYPEIAKRLRITGSVTIEATVDADGKVSNVKTLSGNRMLSPAAEDAVRRWRFEPGSGQAKVDVPINFTLEE